MHSLFVHSAGRLRAPAGTCWWFFTRSLWAAGRGGSQAGGSEERVVEPSETSRVFLVEVRGKEGVDGEHRPAAMCGVERPPSWTQGPGF